jgi:uncharacterized protein YkwD
MKFVHVVLLSVTALAIGCTTGTMVQLGPDGRPLPKIYRIAEGTESAVQFQMLDAINALRHAADQQPITFNSALNAAAATHSKDMAVQNRPWHFGSDGSSPLIRAERSGYQGGFLGETISETFETEIETLSAWMNREDTRGVILDPRARDIGFSWYQEVNGKIWWTLVTGGAAIQAPVQG